MSNQKNVKKLPIEFKQGFTIFYVTDIKQVHKICFESEGLDKTASEKQKQIEELKKDYGVVVEQYDDEEIGLDIDAGLLEQETILKRNYIEELL